MAQLPRVALVDPPEPVEQVGTAQAGVALAAGLRARSGAARGQARVLVCAVPARGRRLAAAPRRLALVPRAVATVADWRGAGLGLACV